MGRSATPVQKSTTNEKSLLNEAQKRLNQGLELSEQGCYARIIEAIGQYVEKEKGRKLTPWMVAAMAQVMENSVGQMQERYGLRDRSFIEDMGTSDVQAMSYHQLPVIAAILPTLAAERVVSIQPMDRSTGVAYYLNYLYDSSKYGVTAGTNMFGAATGPSYMPNYSNNAEMLQIATGNGATFNYTGTLRRAPVNSSSVRFVSGSMTVSDDGAGNLIGDTCTAGGTINYTTGEYSFCFDSPPAAAAAVIAYWTFDFESAVSCGGCDDVIPQVSLELESETLTAEDRYLKARWWLRAAVDLRKNKNLDAEQLLQNACLAEIRHEIDTEIFAALLTAAGTPAAAGAVSFSAATSSAALDLYRYYRNLNWTLSAASTMITDTTGIGVGNVIIAGKDLVQILLGMSNDFFHKTVDYTTQAPNGPHEIGVYMGQFTVIANFGYADDKFVVAYHGGDYLRSGFVYAPYLPALVVGPQQWAEDFRGRVGVMTSYATKLLNAGYYVDGTITP